jgi:hypothetical protein
MGKAKTAKHAVKGEVRIVGIRVDEDGHKAIRMLAAESGKTQQSLGIEALNLLLKKHGGVAVVRNPLLDDE